MPITLIIWWVIFREKEKFSLDWNWNACVVSEQPTSKNAGILCCEAWNRIARLAWRVECCSSSMSCQASEHVVICGVPSLWLNLSPQWQSARSHVSPGPSRTHKRGMHSIRISILKKTSISRGSKRCVPHHSFLMSAVFGVTTAVMEHNK